METSEEDLKKLIYPVGFYVRKAGYIKRATAILLKDYDGDIPDTIEGLVKLPGVGPKMGYLTLQVAWKKMDGIGIDVHMHRICNRLHWVNTKTPEETRVALESWLPKEYWREINPLIVGFGQQICGSKPKCKECKLRTMCPSSEAKDIEDMDFFCVCGETGIQKRNVLTRERRIQLVNGGKQRCVRSQTDNSAHISLIGAK